jgi:hypothetical protein
MKMSVSTGKTSEIFLFCFYFVNQITDNKSVKRKSHYLAFQATQAVDIYLILAGINAR